MPPLRVLVVDDERIVANTLAMVVQSAGHSARAAYSGAEAAAIADELHPDVAISDVMMPGMDGVELARWFDEHQPGCRVLLFSGYIDCATRMARFINAGFLPRPVLTKPVPPREILAFLASCAAEQGKAGR